MIRTNKFQALAKIVFKINVMSVSAHVRNARNHFGEKFEFQNVKKKLKKSKLIFISFVLSLFKLGLLGALNNWGAFGPLHNSR